jgi:ribosomal protein L37E
MMRKFFQTIDKRSREAMAGYLTGHFRYNTMNSWNRSTSYAHNLKIYNLGLEKDIADKLYSMIQVSGFYEPLNDLIRDFGADHGHRWQAGMNGRNSGYLVLYQGQPEPSGYKSYCTRCGQRNYKSVSENGNVCGVCHEPARRDYPHTHMSVVSYPCRGTDEGEGFEDWPMYELRERVELIQEFDRLADAMVAEALWLAKNHDIREESYIIQKTRPVLVPVT